MQRIEITADTRVLVLTGAGVSAESGVPTFRGSNGLWENQPVERVATPEGFAEDPARVWRFYSQRRAGAGACAPNPGHRTLAELEQKLGARFLLATQNVDGLHRRAGNTRLVEMHGNLFLTRCSGCDRPPFPDDTVYPAGHVPECDACAARGARAFLRPHIVWFGEMLEPADLERINDFIADARNKPFVFMAVGTSGAVYPAANLVNLAREVGARTYLVNADPADNQSRFEHFLRCESGKILPTLFDVRT